MGGKKKGGGKGKKKGDDDGPNPEKVNYALETYLESLQ